MQAGVSDDERMINCEWPKFNLLYWNEEKSFFINDRIST